MEFWAIAYRYQEDIYFNFENEEDTSDLTEKCFLPTEDMAIDFIAEQLDMAYVPVKITVERIENNGIWSYSRGQVNEWDENY